MREQLSGCLEASQGQPTRVSNVILKHMHVSVCVHIYVCSFMNSVSRNMFRSLLLLALHYENGPVVSTCNHLLLLITEMENLLF